MNLFDLMQPDSSAPNSDCGALTSPAMPTPDNAPGAPKIGDVVRCDKRGFGYIVAINRPKFATSILTGGGMVSIQRVYDVAFYHKVDSIDDIALPDMMESARYHGGESMRLSADDLQSWHDHALKQQRAAKEQARAASDALTAKRNAWRDDARAKMPQGARAVIYAEYRRDTSDIYSDYFNSSVEKIVILAWSTHTRDLFAEMRKAAAHFPETAHLATADAKAEHREKYSMGAGYYLKDGGRNSTGWGIRKQSIGASGFPLDQGDWHLAPDLPAARTSAATPAVAVDIGPMSIEPHIHTKKGFDMWICVLPERVDSDCFNALREAARAAGGWYSRKWGNAPAGFAFKSEAAAIAFAGGDHGGGGDAAAVSKESQGENCQIARPALGDKLRAMADAMQSAVDDKFRDRRANTPKRQRQAASARIDGFHLERTQKALRALAACHDDGTVPACLARVTSKKDVHELATEGVDRSRSGYYDAGLMTGKPYDWAAIGYPAKAEQAAALWALLDSPVDTGRAEAEALRLKIEKLQFAKIPGYFPTPAPIVARMIEAAGISAGARVLEPSAGSGAIADAVKAAGCAVECIERQSSLVEILRAKGHGVLHCDFLETDKPGPGALFDAVIMNPPFENGQDVEHVRHAWQFVKTGGRLVAVMSAGVEFRQDKRFSEFRSFVDEFGGEIVRLPDGAFKESGTGVATVMLTLWKES